MAHPTLMPQPDSAPPRKPFWRRTPVVAVAGLLIGVGIGGTVNTRDAFDRDNDGVGCE